MKLYSPITTKSRDMTSSRTFLLPDRRFNSSVNFTSLSSVCNCSRSLSASRRLDSGSGVSRISSDGVHDKESGNINDKLKKDVIQRTMYENYMYNQYSK